MSMRLFNVDADHFAADLEGTPELQLQNALVRLGATHLRESERVVPKVLLGEVDEVVHEALTLGLPRLTAALGPVVVENIERFNTWRVEARLAQSGLERRLPWLAEKRAGGAPAAATGVCAPLVEAAPVERLRVRRFIESLLTDERVKALLEPLDGDGAGALELLLEVLSLLALANPRVIKRVLNRLQLLLHDSGVRTRLARLNSEEQRRRFITWVAGAERFRSFRFFFRDAGEGESSDFRDGLGLLVSGQSPSFATTAARQLAEVPGFLDLYHHLIGKADPVGQRVSSGHALITLADFDALMRSVGQ